MVSCVSSLLSPVDGFLCVEFLISCLTVPVTVLLLRYCRWFPVCKVYYLLSYCLCYCVTVDGFLRVTFLEEPDHEACLPLDFLWQNDYSDSSREMAADQRKHQVSFVSPIVILIYSCTHRTCRRVSN